MAPLTRDEWSPTRIHLSPGALPETRPRFRKIRLKNAPPRVGKRYAQRNIGRFLDKGGKKSPNELWASFFLSRGKRKIPAIKGESVFPNTKESVNGIVFLALWPLRFDVEYPRGGRYPFPLSRLKDVSSSIDVFWLLTACDLGTNLSLRKSYIFFRRISTISILASIDLDLRLYSILAPVSEVVIHHPECLHIFF